MLFRYGPSVPFPQDSTPLRAGAGELMFRREQSNSTDGTLTHVETSFTGAGFVCCCKVGACPVSTPRKQRKRRISPLVPVPTPDRLHHRLASVTVRASSPGPHIQRTTDNELLTHSNGAPERQLSQTEGRLSVSRDRK